MSKHSPRRHAIAEAAMYRWDDRLMSDKALRKMARGLRKVEAKWMTIPLARPELENTDPKRELAEAESNAIVIHPMFTGVGSQPRTLADADYVHNCRYIIKLYGRKAFAAALIRLLKMTDDMPWTTEATRSGPLPAPVEAAHPRELPFPAVATAQLRDTFELDFTENPYALGRRVNPVIAGIGPYPAMMVPTLWAYNFARLLKERGIDQTLVDFLFMIRHTFGAHGIAAGHLPDGYTKGSALGGFFGSLLNKMQNDTSSGDDDDEDSDDEDDA